MTQILNVFLWLPISANIIYLVSPQHRELQSTMGDTKVIKDMILVFQKPVF